MSRRYDLGFGDQKLNDITFPLWHYGVVVRVDDPNDAGRIKVRIEDLDKKIYAIHGGKNKQDLKNLGHEAGDAHLPWCEPLLPKFLNIVPKEGEMVRVAIFDYTNTQQRRQYIGPVIGQETPLDFNESNYNTAKLRVDNSAYSPAISESPLSKVGNWGIYPNKTDIGLLGRRNTDLILRNESNYDEVILRAGKIDYKTIGQQFPVNLNLQNPAYLTINHTQPKYTGNGDYLPSNSNRSHINLVADRLNLISHLGSSNKGKSPVILDGDNTDTQITTENTKLHPVIYGDSIWDMLEKLRAYVEGHLHKGSRREPDGDQTKNDLIKWFNENMGTRKTKKNPDGTSYVDYENCKFLSKGVRTN